MLLSAKRRAYFRRSIAIEMGGVSRYFSKVSGSGVDLTPLSNGFRSRRANRSEIHRIAWVIFCDAHRTAQMTCCGPI